MGSRKPSGEEKEGTGKKPSTPVAPPEYARKLSKDEINLFPIQRWTGEIRIINKQEDVAEAVSALEKETILGFDTETRPIFKKGITHKPALLQLAGEECIYLFQLQQLSNLEAPFGLLDNPKIVKAGVALDQDIQQLKRLAECRPQNMVDLARIAEATGMASRGLRSLGAALFHFRISKRAQCSNWEETKLRKQQVTYAATDAWVSRKIYLRMQELGLLKR